MAYHFKQEEPVDKGIRRIALEQIDIASKSLRKNEDTGVHMARKRLKCIRSLLRLSRSALKDDVFKTENRRYRDIARSLSGARDAQVMLETLDGLKQHYGKRLPKTEIKPFRTLLRNRYRKAEKALNGNTVSDVLAELKKGKKHFSRLSLNGGGFASIAEGLEETHRRGRNTFINARKTKKADYFHEWRKDVQQHWRQMLLLGPIKPKLLKARAKTASKLSQVLGEDHDLEVLADLAQKNRKVFRRKRDVRRLLFLIAKRQKELRKQALKFGRRIYDEKSKPFRNRMIKYWATSRASSKYRRMAEGMEKTRKRDRNAFKKAGKIKKAELFHERRKDVQQHRRQMPLPVPIKPKLLKAHAKTASELSQILGEDQELAVLANLARENRSAFHQKGDAKKLLVLIAKLQTELRKQAIKLGRRICDEKPKPFRKRMTTYWGTSRPSAKLCFQVA